LANPEQPQDLRALYSAGVHQVDDAAGGLPVFDSADAQATKR